MENENNAAGAVEKPDYESSNAVTVVPGDAAVSVRDLVLREYQAGNLVFFDGDNLRTCPLEEFLKQPADGILYDLNRSEPVVLSYIDDPKWVNDYAVAKVIRALKAKLEEKE